MARSGQSLVITAEESSTLRLFRVFLGDRPEQEITTDGSALFHAGPELSSAARRSYGPLVSRMGPPARSTQGRLVQSPFDGRHNHRAHHTSAVRRCQRLSRHGLAARRPGHGAPRRSALDTVGSLSRSQPRRTDIILVGMMALSSSRRNLRQTYGIMIAREQRQRGDRGAARVPTYLDCAQRSPVARGARHRRGKSRHRSR